MRRVALSCHLEYILRMALHDGFVHACCVREHSSYALTQPPVPHPGEPLECGRMIQVRLHSRETGTVGSDSSGDHVWSTGYHMPTTDRSC